MSSAVNKSQKRFMPKVSSRGPGGRAPAQRLSTLRASFSVPTAPTSDLSKSASAKTGAEKPQEKPSRSQLLGLGPGELPETRELLEATESAVDDSAPEPKRVKFNGVIDQAAPLRSLPRTRRTSRALSFSAKADRSANIEQEPESSQPIDHSDSHNTPAAESSPSLALPTPSASLPGPVTPASSIQRDHTDSSFISAKSRSRAIAKPGSRSASSVLSSASSLPSAKAAASIQLEVPISAPNTAVIPEVVTPSEPKPAAPEGYEYIWPEDLPKRRAEERRRKMAVEKELLSIMRELYTAKEKQRILTEHVGMDDDIAQTIADEAAAAATYNQLKQKVGVEAKQKRDSLHNNESDRDDENSKTLLDVNKFTMAALCKDIPVGDRNTLYDDYELARVNRRRDTVRVFRAKMWSRRMYQPKENERAALREAYQKYQNERKERNGKIKTEQEQKFTEIDDASETVDSLGGHPQASIEIQANGSISLVGTQFDRHKNNRTQREGGLSGPKTEVDPTEQVINSYSYSTRERPDRWTPEETTKFYEAVSALGTDFNLIAHLFPMRSRNQIKTKYKYEEKRNPAKLQIHLVSRRKFSLESYSKVSNVAIQEVGTIENELEKVRKEHAEQMKMEEEARLVAKVEDQKKSTPERKQKPVAGPKRERRD